MRRTRDDRVIGGVCGGLGRYLGVDPVLMRIAFVILAFAGGGGILVYLVAWVLIPVERPGEDLGTAWPAGADTTRLLVGGALERGARRDRRRSGAGGGAARGFGLAGRRRRA